MINKISDADATRIFMTWLEDGYEYDFEIIKDGICFYRYKKNDTKKTQN